LLRQFFNPRFKRTSEKENDMGRRKIIITHSDRQRLAALIDRASEVGLVDRRAIDDLGRELSRATMVDPNKCPDNVITMNSTVRLQDLDSGEVSTYTLVYPAEANVEENRISVLAPVGTAIIGYRTGDVIKWPVPGGHVRLRVEDVFQPEHAGASGP
jgi:regulator of nucleoside diphosphate kinase